MSKVLWLWCASVIACLPCPGQVPKHGNHAGHPAASAVTPSALVPVPVPLDAQTALTAMVARAGVIFAGHVLEIAPGDGFVDVTFRIDEPVRGGSKLGVYVLREWAGLWSGQPARFRIGQRLLMLLTNRSASGMSAPVGGDEGVIPIAAAAVEPVADAHGVAPAEDGSVATDITGMVAGLRLTRAPRAAALVYAAVEPVSSPGGPVERRGPATPLAENLSTPAGQPTLAAVLAILRNAAGYVAGPGSGHVAQ